MNITVLGLGTWGSAIAGLLSENGHSVTLWGRDQSKTSRAQELRVVDNLDDYRLPPEILVSSDLEMCLNGAQCLIAAVSSQAIGPVIKSCVPYLESDTIVVNVAKGIENESLRLMHEVISNELPNPVAVLSGPSHAEEVCRRLPTTCVAASNDTSIAAIVQDLFMNRFFRVYTNQDLIGVELGGALKNVISLAAGICDGMGFGDNAKAALMTRGMVEIARLGAAMGARTQTFSGLSGIGDLIVTCTSQHSRNRRAGYLMGQGKSVTEAQKEVGMVVEGMYTARAAYKLSQKYSVDMPITEQINQALEGKSPGLAVADLMSRDRTTEDRELLDWI